MAKKKTQKHKSNKTTIIAAVIIALAVGLYFGVAVIPAINDSSSVTAQAPAGAGASDMSARIDHAKADAEANPGSARSWSKLGDLYFDSGQHFKAIDAYKASLAIDPSNSHVLTDLGVMYRRTDRPEEAVKYFDKAIEASTDNYTPYFNKGIVLFYDLHDKSGAIRVWERLLEIKPDAKTPNGKPLRQMIQELS